MIQTVTAVLSFVSFFLLLIVTAIRPRHSKFNHFELERRANIGDRGASKALERERLLADVVSSQRIIIALLQVAVWLFSGIAFGSTIGVIVAILIAFGYGALAKFRFLRKWSQRIYERHENSILKLIDKHPRIFQLLRSAPTDDHTYSLHVDSREELQHLVAESEGVLTADEKKLIINSLSFDDKLVRAIMTPRENIISIKKTEFLGPLVLDDLHKVGHSRLPVINGDVDHIIGILYLKSLLSLDNKRSMTAEKAMEKRVFYIREDQTLHHALAAFLRTHHLLFIVVNEQRETVGLITIGDVIKAMIGRKIIDEFDSHESLMAVASRDLTAKNRPAGYEDI